MWNCFLYKLLNPPTSAVQDSFILPINITVIKINLNCKVIKSISRDIQSVRAPDTHPGWRTSNWRQGPWPRPPHLTRRSWQVRWAGARWPSAISFPNKMRSKLWWVWWQVPSKMVSTNVSIERLGARSKIRKKSLHSNDVARGAKSKQIHATM